MLAQQLGRLVAPLGGRHAPADDRHGVHRIEAGDPSGAAEMARPHQIGLLQIAWEPSSRRRVGFAALAPARPPLGIAVPPEDALDRAERRHRPHPLVLQLEVDHFGAAARKPRSSSPSLLQSLSNRHNARDDAVGGSLPLPLRGSAARTQPGPPLLPIPPQPLGHPGAGAPQALPDDAAGDALSVQFDCSMPQSILITRVRHRPLPGLEALRGLLPCSPSASSRCDKGSAVLNVMKGTP